MAAITHPIHDSNQQPAVTKALLALTAISMLVGLAAIADDSSQPSPAPIVEMTPTGTTVPDTAPSTTAVDR